MECVVMLPSPRQRRIPDNAPFGIIEPYVIKLGLYITHNLQFTKETRYPHILYLDCILGKACI